jgi:uncharacterized protein YacL
MDEIKKAAQQVEQGGANQPSPRFISQLADEVARTLMNRIPSMLPSPRRRRKDAKKAAAKTIEHGIFLDTSAIIDGRIFGVIRMGLLGGDVVILQSILLELKHIADSQDMVRRQRGQDGLSRLETLKKARGSKVRVLSSEDERVGKKPVEVDERLIQMAKMHKGRIITCDYNLEKKASIEGVTAINMNALAQVLKVAAVPGEALHIMLSHIGKEIGQGVGYLDDGTMLVVENGGEKVGQNVDVVVTRVIQTVSGRILFAKLI